MKKETTDRSNENSISLNKYISSTGICSRREANKFIADGRVTINDEPTKLGNRVFEGDIVKIDGKPLKEKPKPIYIACNKPMGIVCTTDSKEPNNIVRFVNHKERLFPVGRLDRASQGLIFLTNDGDIVNKILRAGNNHQKEYIVEVTRPITPDFVQNMSDGVPILDTITKPCTVIPLDDFRFKIILTQGLNRQIRRMCDYLGYQVRRLERIRIMNIELGHLKYGQWRILTQREIDGINKMIANSSKTEEASKDENKQVRKKPFAPKTKSFKKNRPPLKEISFGSKKTTMSKENTKENKIDKENIRTSEQKLKEVSFGKKSNSTKPKLEKKERTPKTFQREKRVLREISFGKKKTDK